MRIDTEQLQSFHGSALYSMQKVRDAKRKLLELKAIVAREKAKAKGNNG